MKEVPKPQAQTTVQTSLASDLRLYAAAGVKTPIQAIKQQFEQSSGLTLICDFDTAGAAQAKFLQDPGARFLITTQERIAASQAGGLLVPGRAIALADTVAAIACSQQEKPRIETGEDLRRALLDAASIAFSDPARGATVGKHFLTVIAKLGIEREVLAKARLAHDGVETMRLVQQGLVVLGITQMSEVVQAAPNTLVGPFPPEFDLFTRYVLWIKGPETEPIGQFVQWLTSSQGRSIFVNQGLRPVF